MLIGKKFGIAFLFALFQGCATEKEQSNLNSKHKDIVSGKSDLIDAGFYVNQSHTTKKGEIFTENYADKRWSGDILIERNQEGYNLDLFEKQSPLGFFFLKMRSLKSSELVDFPSKILIFEGSLENYGTGCDAEANMVDITNKIKVIAESSKYNVCLGKENDLPPNSPANIFVLPIKPSQKKSIKVEITWPRKNGVEAKFVLSAVNLVPKLEMTPTPVDPDFNTVDGFNLDHEVATYKRYNLDDVYKKAVDGKGVGYTGLYGTRNFRVVLKGVYYRGGANNSYFAENKRDNRNPLQNKGLKNLCQEGFSTAIYFYSTNYETAPKVTSCDNSRELNYKQISVLSNEKRQREVLTLIFKRIKGELSGPIYGHCWNGWHASGLAATLALRQFCDLPADQAEKYWEKNTDGNFDGYTSIRNYIRNFKKIPELSISSAEKKAICPVM